MGFFDQFRRDLRTVASEQKNEPDKVCIGADVESMESKTVRSFSTDGITFSGSVTGYDYTSILRDKQKNINLLYEQSDYYSDADAVYRGIIKHVYTPYASTTPFKLIGGTAKTRTKFMDYYTRIKLSDKWKSIALQYFKYANVYIYLFNGDIITLPPHKCRITNMSLSGDPLVEYDVESIANGVSGFMQSSNKKFYDDDKLQKILEGYPPEIGEGVKRGDKWVQMNPENMFVMQAPKEDWQRYAIPMIASALVPLSKKALISKYEDAAVNLGTRGFVHVKYGDIRKDDGYLPSRPELNSVQRLFQKGMSGYPLVVTNHLSEAKFVQSNMQDLFQWDKYRQTNNDILSSGGVSGIIVSGVSQGGSTFASAQVSMKTVAVRIQQAMDTFAEIMNKINMRMNGDEKGVTKTRSSSVPTFIFMPLEMDGRKELEKSCLALWKEGVLSYETMLNTMGYDMDDEVIRREHERNIGIHDILDNAPKTYNETSQGGNPESPSGDSVSPDEETRGRKALDDSERNSPPDDAERGKMPKPSNPEGSL